MPASPRMGPSVISTASPGCKGEAISFMIWPSISVRMASMTSSGTWQRLPPNSMTLRTFWAWRTARRETEGSKRAKK